MIEKLKDVEKRLEEINELLTQPEVVTDNNRYKALMREHKALTPIVEKFREYLQAAADRDEAEEMLAAGGLDQDFKGMVLEQLTGSRERLESITGELKLLLLPRDVNDDKNVIIEIRGGAGGDEAALQVLLRRFGPLIRYILRPILPDERDREECFADISLRIWQNAAGFDGEKGSLNGWLTALSRNAALNRARGQRQTDTPLEDGEAQGHSAEEELLRRERRSRLRAVIAALPVQERDLFYRKYYYCQSTAQMAAELGLTERAVEGRLYRLRQGLRQMCGGELDD